jgi:glycosyltransferase involved in cell wall biosynthesis
MAPSLSICTMVRNEGPYLAEWIAYYFSVEVKEIRLYDNGSDDETAVVVDRLSRHFPVVRVPWTHMNATHDVVQNAAFTDAVPYFAGKSDFVAFVDADEFLVPSSGRSLSKSLEGFSKAVGAIAVNQLMFGSSGELNYRPELVIRRFTRRAQRESVPHFWVKSIARPECLMPFRNVHWACLSAGEYVFADGTIYEPSASHPGRATRIVKDPPIKLHHYGLKSLAEFRAKKARFSKAHEFDGKFTDSFFMQVDAGANLEEDLSALAFAPAVEHLLKRVHEFL